MNRLKECRINAGYSQKFVAASLKIAAPSVSNWESGKTFPSSENLIELAKLYGVSIDYLMGSEVAGDMNVAHTPETAKNEKKPADSLSELDAELVQKLTSLSPAEVQRVWDFIAGMKAR